MDNSLLAIFEKIPCTVVHLHGLSEILEQFNYFFECPWPNSVPISKHYMHSV